MRLVSNFIKNATHDIEACAQIAGLKYEIRQEAYRLDNKALIPDHAAIWCADDQKIEIDKFFNCYIMLADKLRKRYLDAGVPEELLDRKMLYRGCEKEYFPEYIPQIREAQRQRIQNRMALEKE